MPAHVVSLGRARAGIGDDGIGTPWRASLTLALDFASGSRPHRVLRPLSPRVPVSLGAAAEVSPAKQEVFQARRWRLSSCKTCCAEVHPIFKSTTTGGGEPLNTTGAGLRSGMVGVGPTSCRRSVASGSFRFSPEAAGAAPGVLRYAYVSFITPGHGRLRRRHPGLRPGRHPRLARGGHRPALPRHHGRPAGGASLAEGGRPGSAPRD